MDGFYDGSGEFTTFEDQCRQIEEYVNKNHGGKLYGVYGVSQGTIVLSEFLARNRIRIEKAFFDGTYVAHQGKIAGLGTNWMFATAFCRFHHHAGLVGQSRTAARSIQSFFHSPAFASS